MARTCRLKILGACLDVWVGWLLRAFGADFFGDDATMRRMPNLRDRADEDIWSRFKKKMSDIVKES